MYITYIIWNFLVATFRKGKFNFNKIFYFPQYVQNIISTCHHYKLLISSIQFFTLKTLKSSVYFALTARLQFD